LPDLFLNACGALDGMFTVIRGRLTRIRDKFDCV